jgi:hypothetical protein
MKYKTLIILLLIFTSSGLKSEALDYFSKPMTRLDFAVYTMRQNADELFKYALEDNNLNAQVTSGVVTYLESPLEIKVMGRAWGFKDSELTQKKCMSVLKAYSQSMNDGSFWEKVGSTFREQPFKKAEMGREMSKYFTYNVFLGKEIPLDNKKRIQCKAKHLDIWPDKSK